MQSGSEDIAAIDVHYPNLASAIATVVLLEGASLPDSAIPALLSELDEQLIPSANLDDRSLQFTVVRGRSLGTFTAAPD